MQVLNIIGISIICVFLLFIFMKKEKGGSDYLLIVVNVLFGAFLFSDIWIRQGLTPANFIFHNLLTFYLFPTFVSYGLLLINNNAPIPKKYFWIYTYAVVFTLFIVLDFTVLTDYDTDLLRERYEYPTLTYHFFYKSHKLFVIFTLLWFLNLLKEYRVKIKDFYSFIEPLQLDWLKKFVFTYMLVNTVSLFAFLSYNFAWIQNIDTPYAIINGVLVIALFYLSYNGIRQYTLAGFDDSGSRSAVPGADHETKYTNLVVQEKYKTSSLAENDIDSIFEKLKELFQKEEIYLEPQLKIQSVADQLQTSSHHLSQTINTKTGKPFYEFVNSYRVDKLKEKLVSEEFSHLTILALGLDCGFNSKASLNRIFKSHTQLSPSQYRKSHLLK